VGFALEDLTAGLAYNRAMAEDIGAEIEIGW
jgi:hypothetical protein